MKKGRSLQIAPAAVLFSRARAISSYDDSLRDLVADMYRLMYAYDGVGLAGPQAGELLRVAVIDLRGRVMRAAMEETSSAAADIADASTAMTSDASEPSIVTEDVAADDFFVDDCREAREPFALVNPEITWRGDDLRCYEEGCLSFPDLLVEVERPRSVEVSYHDLDGERHVVRAHGLLSICLQHEIDHLDGRTIIDSLSRLRRSMVMRRYAKQSRQSHQKGEGRDNAETSSLPSLG